MNNSKILIISAGGAVLMLVVIWLGWGMRNLDCRDFDEAKVTINFRDYYMALANTDAERAQGLQACHAVPDQSGMLFLLPDRQKPTFWMKGMVIPLDIVWIRDGKVLSVETNVPPVNNQTENPTIYSPGLPVDAVIEVGANRAATLGLTPGATVEY